MRLRAAPAFASALLVWAGSSEAAPAVVDQCASASEQAQLLRLKGRLVETRAELVTCSRRGCPAVIRKDCERWLNEVDEALPSAIISVRDEQGADIVDAKVRVDGKPALEAVDGRAVMIDPGPHDVEVLAPGRPPTARKVVFHEGEKRRAVDFSFAPASASSPPPRPSTAAQPVPTGSGSRIVGWSLIALGGASAAAGTFFTVRGESLYDAAETECAPGCPIEKKDAIDTARVVAGIAFGVGFAAVVGGIVLLVTQPGKPSARIDGVVVRF